MKWLLLLIAVFFTGCASTAKTRTYQCSIVDGGKELIHIDKKFKNVYDAEMHGELLKMGLQIEGKLKPTAYVDCFTEKIVNL